MSSAGQHMDMVVHYTTMEYEVVVCMYVGQLLYFIQTKQ